LRVIKKKREDTTFGTVSVRTESYLRLIDFLYHSTLGSRVIKEKKKVRSEADPNYCTEMCSGSEAGSYVRLIDFCITFRTVSVRTESPIAIRL